jgi:hypothetical protein
MSLSRQGGPQLHVHMFRGDPRIEQMCSDLRSVASRVMSWGCLVTPDVPLVTALSWASAGGSSPDGCTLVFSEGTWDFGATTFTIALHRINFVALAPGRTVFRRASNVVLPSRADVLTVTGNDVQFRGLRFVDSVGASGDACINLKGTRNVVEDCVFEDCELAVSLSGTATRAMIRNNYVLAARNTSYSMLAAGTHSRCQFLGNQFESAPTSSIYASDTTSTSVFMGNVAASGSTYVANYKTVAAPDANVGDATMNIGAVNVRP